MKLLLSKKGRDIITVTAVHSILIVCTGDFYLDINVIMKVKYFFRILSCSQKLL